MQDYSKNRAKSPQLGLLLVGLSIAVFMWGLGYKLSLYNSTHTSSHPIPSAKLLSKDQQGTAQDDLVTAFKNAADAKVTFAVVPIALLLLLLTSANFVAQDSRWREREIGRPWLLRWIADKDAFFFRPPPVLSL